MEIRKATTTDIAALRALFEEARATIARLGIDQWQNGYPSVSVIAEDIALARSYVVIADGTLCGTFVLMEDGEPCYDQIYEGSWKSDGGHGDYIAIHRVAVAKCMRGTGVSTAIIDAAASRARALGRTSLRIDTHQGNIVMRRMLEKHGFAFCGEIRLESGEPRVAYEKLLP